MINKKVFALTLVASSVIAAGCSSDDDGDEGDMGTVTPPVEVMDNTSAAVDGSSLIDVDGNGGVDDNDDINGDGFVNQDDVDAFAMNGGTPPPTTVTEADLPDGTDYDPDALTPAGGAQPRRDRHGRRPDAARPERRRLRLRRSAVRRERTPDRVRSDRRGVR